jgi:Tol biopolymer transport system component
MSTERWAEIDRVLNAVLARPQSEREEAIAQLCAADDELRREVESLLANLSHASAAGFGASPGISLPSGSLVGCQVGPYHVRELVGVGGMGEVYRAHDSTLGRDVALKILPDLWLADPERRGRFEREARVLASLNHPNIAAIYGVHDSVPDAVHALVLELVEGETLANRLSGRENLPPDETMQIAVQIADALEAAHARGIVHRDLKPSNIKITPEGRVKVLDFGLARTLEGGDERNGAVASSPTVTVQHTQAGILLGTAPYMSPEQARGHTADRRSDIWAFGCVLYEMVTGRAAFAGADVTDVLANVLRADPDWSALPGSTPRALRLCLERCLQKDQRQRFHDIGDVRLALTGAFDLPEHTRPAHPARQMAWATWILVLLAAGGAAAIALASRRAASQPETRLEIATPPAMDPMSIDISPDGRSVVVEAIDAGVPRLWLRRLDVSEGKPLAGTDFATLPFWSHDGRSIGFFGVEGLKRIDLEQGFVRTLAPAPYARGGTWNRDGTIVFGATAMGPLHSVPAGGGSVTQVTDLLPGQTSHRWPHFLPDGRRFLLMALGRPDVRGLYLGSLDDRAVQKVADRDAAFGFMPPDVLLVERNGGVMARRLSADGLAVLEGEPIPVAPKLLVSPLMTGHWSLRTSAAGHLIHRVNAQRSQPVWLDRAGRQVGTVGEPDDSGMEIQDLSPDGRTVVVQRMVNGNSDMWAIDIDRGVLRRLSAEPGFDGMATFSSDGRRLAYMSDGATDVYDRLYVRSADGTGERALLADFGVSENHYPEDWSPDGRFILYSRENPKTQMDLFALPATGGRPIVVAASEFSEAPARFSPDGRWVTYGSNETGVLHVFIRPFPGPGPSRQVSSSPGSFQPRWRRDGGEIFFIERDRMMSVPVGRSSTKLEFGPPRALFTLPPDVTRLFEPSVDGQRFLFMRTVTEASPITLIQNWKWPR